MIMEEQEPLLFYFSATASTSLPPLVPLIKQMENISINISINSSIMQVDNCTYKEPDLTTLRFWIVTVFGTGVALCSIVENTFFFYLFSTRPHHRNSFNLYMLFIALFDVFISSSYIFLMSMNVLMDFLRSLILFRIWHYYMVPMITISHCAITSGSFLILAATIERYFLTANSKYVRTIQKNRRWIILFAILMGIISKVTICLEFEVKYREECANTMSEIDIRFADFVFDTDYHLYWRFYYRNFVTIFFPFFALLFLNLLNTHVLARFEKENYQFQMLVSATATAKHLKRKKITRAATITTILVVCTYLISNILSVALTTWEHINKKSLVEMEGFYMISIDLSSLLTVMACAFRPLIYLICQPALRKEVFFILKRVFRLNNRKLDDDPKMHSAFEPINSLEISTPCNQPSFITHQNIVNTNNNNNNIYNMSRRNTGADLFVNPMMASSSPTIKISMPGSYQLISQQRQQQYGPAVPIVRRSSPPTEKNNNNIEEKKELMVGKVENRIPLGEQLILMTPSLNIMVRGGSVQSILFNDNETML